MANQILRVFLNTDMRNQHDGLMLLAAKKAKVRCDNLSDGEHVIFINRQATKIKVFSSRGVLSYMRNGNRRLDLTMVQYLPSCFNASGFDFDKAEELALEKKLKRKT